MSLADMMNQERERLKGLLTDLDKKKADIDKEIEKVQFELNAISIYEDAKAGKIPVNGTAKRKGSVRSTVLNVIKENKDGMTRATILEALGAKGDKKKEQSISNCLSTLKNSAQIKLENGTYSVA